MCVRRRRVVEKNLTKGEWGGRMGGWRDWPLSGGSGPARGPWDPLSQGGSKVRRMGRLKMSWLAVQVESHGAFLC